MSEYFSISDILADEERVPCRWHIGAKGVGYLDPSSIGEDISPEQDMDLPVWLVGVLKKQNFVDVQLPKTFSVRLRQGLLADALTVRLREKSPHFYEVGLRMADLVNTEDTLELPSDIKRTLATRVRDILETAPKSLGKDVSKYRTGLTDLEMTLYDELRTYSALKMRWRRRQEETLEATSGGASRVVASASLPQSRGQKRDRSLLSTSGT